MKDSTLEGVSDNPDSESERVAKESHRGCISIGAVVVIFWFTSALFSSAASMPIDDHTMRVLGPAGTVTLFAAGAVFLGICLSAVLLAVRSRYWRPAIVFTFASMALMLAGVILFVAVLL